jgi:hypothetical protein
MLLVLVVGVALAWQSNRARRQRAAVAALRALGVTIRYDHEYDARGLSVTDSRPWGPQWLHKLIGPEYFQEVYAVTFGGRRRGPRVTDADVRPLRDLPELRRLDLMQTDVTDSSLAWAGRMPHLRVIWLMNKQLTDAGVAHLAGLSELEEIYLSDSRVTGAGLASLRHMRRLRLLWLGNTQVTDAGLVHLAELGQLRRLNLVGTRVTGTGLVHLKGLTGLVDLYLPKGVSDEEVADLQRALPKLKISRQ